MQVFDRANASPRYRELIALYKRMHLEGETTLGVPAAQTFPGSSLLPHVPGIKRMIMETRSRTLLDYGSGKGLQYRPQKIIVDGAHLADSIAEYWDVDEVRCYDPAYAPHSVLPDGTFDGVICTDVLEHCPEEDLPWIVAEILSFASRFAYLNVACFPARKRLPTGENAHVTVRSPGWWKEMIEKCAPPRILWELHAAEDRDGQIRDTAFRGA